MRIGLFTDVYLPHLGGVETSVHNHYLALKSMGHTVFIICPEDPSAKASEKYVVRLQTWSGGLKNILPQVLINRCNKQLIHSLELDLVHEHFQGTVSLLAAWSARKHSIPFFQTIHSDAIAWYDDNSPMVSRSVDTRFLLNRYKLQAARLGLDSSVNLKSNPNVKHYSLIIKRQLMVSKYARKVLFPSSRLMKDFAQYYSDKDFILVPNGVDIKNYKPEFSDLDKPIRFLWVGRMAKEKRPLVFLKALEVLHRETEVRFEVDIAGDGPLLAESERYAVDKFMGYVRFRGGLLPDETAKLYRQADVFALTSYWFDNQPMVIAEASAAGIPVVLSDDRLSIQVCPEGRYLADDASPEALAKAMKRALAKKTKESARPIIKFAKENYDLNVLADRLKRAYAVPPHPRE